MLRTFAVLVPSTLALLAGCSSTSSGVADPTLAQEAEERKRLAAETESRLFAPERLLTDLDKSIDKYVQYRMSGGSERADATGDKIAAFIKEQTERNFDAVVHEADTSDYPRNRAIAVAALGFTGRSTALDPILNAAGSDNVEVVANAMLGLAMLHDPRTPPGIVARVIEDDRWPDTVHAGAAWALYEVQQVVFDQAPIVAIWKGLLAGPIDANPPGVVVSAVRGLGFARDTANIDVLLRYVTHPVPLVRTATAIALGRIGDPRAVDSLIALIGPAETNENVRLAARKALQALAGGIDRSYDVDEWKRVFERGS